MVHYYQEPQQFFSGAYTVFVDCQLELTTITGLREALQSPIIIPQLS